MKRGVMTYGPLTISYHHSGSYLNGTSYYYTGAKDANHSVAVVGWDDNYSTNNFKTHPPANGAFIIRNSWGASWGEKGYFYLTYYDTSLCRDGTSTRTASPSSASRRRTLPFGTTLSSVLGT